MPKGFRTEAGPRPDYARRFGVRETSSANYRSRTKQNVIDSDATVIFSGPRSPMGVYSPPSYAPISRSRA